MKPVDVEKHFPWYVDSSDTDNLDCQCGQQCDGIAGWATHLTKYLNLKGDNMNLFDKFIEVWGRADLAHDIGENLRCEELDRLVEIFRFFGQDDIADKWVAAHAIGDDCGDQHCACVHCNGGEQACAESQHCKVTT